MQIDIDGTHLNAQLTGREIEVNLVHQVSPAKREGYYKMITLRYPNGFARKTEMPEQLTRELTVFLKLADAYQKKHQFPDRDRTLVLAGSCASLLGLESIASFCRHLVLQNNRGHMIGKYSGFRVAVTDDDFQVFLKQLARRFPFEKSESLLQSLNYTTSIQRTDYASDSDFFCGILAIEPEWLEDNFG